MKRLVIGILAHVDAGKTTLSEALLYRAGEIRRLGRVDHRDAFLDTHPLERSRGITIFSKQAVLHLPQAQLTLLDTPGHMDFSAETERTLSVLDCAVLVISGTNGVQGHTETLWRLLRRYRVPTFVFINKMDLPGADKGALAVQLAHRLGAGCVELNPRRPKAELLEELALCSDRLMDEYLSSGTLQPDSIAGAIAARQVFPCFYGCALTASGVDELLDGLQQLVLQPAAEKNFAARVFKIGQDAQGARLTYLKVTGGSLRVRDELSLPGPSGEELHEKVSGLRIYSGDRFVSVSEALPGDVCAAVGLSCTAAGQGLGTERSAAAPLLAPVAACRLILPEGTDPHTALTRLQKLEEEDPQLHLCWDSRRSEISVQLMGQIQLEVLKSIILQRFGLAVEFGPGRILYKETIAAPVEGAGHYEPLRHYAEVHLLLKPGEPGSGLTFAADCREDELDRNWQRLILTHLAEKQHLGVLTGSPITDMTITLIAGKAHQKHTEGGDFRQATYRAVRQGLRRAQSVLLEPWYEFELELPDDCVGRAMSDLQRMGCTFSAPQQNGGSVLLSGRAPAAVLQTYAQDVTAYTRGKGRLCCVMAGYAPCHNAEEVIAQIGYDPDADTENTADSVFCSHGAGCTVNWSDAAARMHIQAGRTAVNPPDCDPQPVVRPRGPASSAALDKELLQIFERTYGPVRRTGPRPFDPALKSTPSGEAPDRTVSPLPDGPEYLLVDGYNIIFAWDELSLLAKDSLESARARLADILCNYQGIRGCEVILVFDAYKVKGNPGAVEQYHNIHIVYTREAETADMYIEKITRDLGRRHGVRVATSDGLEQIIILGHGALRLSAAAFLREVKDAEQALRRILEQMP